MISKECLDYCQRAIIQYMDGNTKEFERLRDLALKENVEEEKWTNCLYKVNGQKIKAKINFKSGIVTDMQGNVLRGANVC